MKKYILLLSLLCSGIAISQNDKILNNSSFQGKINHRQKEMEKDVFELPQKEASSIKSENTSNLRINTNRNPRETDRRIPESAQRKIGSYKMESKNSKPSREKRSMQKPLENQIPGS